MLNRRKARIGLYRIRYPAGLESDVRTREIDGTEELTIAEPLYRARGYQPPFEELPWQSDYFAAHGSSVGKSSDGQFNVASENQPNFT